MSNPFEEKAGKLGTLFRVGASQAVLLIGAEMRPWERDFRARFHEARYLPALRDGAFPTPEGADRWGLVLWDASHGGFARDLRRSLGMARQALSARGALFLLAGNRLSLRTLAREPGIILSREAATCWGWANRLRSAGFDRVEEFLPLPGLACPEEFVESRRGDITLTTQFSRFEKNFHALRLFRYIHDGYAFLASGHSGGTGPILDALSSHIADVSGAPVRLVLERFDLRDRGALLLIVKDMKTSRRLVARVATSSAVSQVVRRNSFWVAKIRDDSRISSPVKSMVPRHLGNFDMGDDSVFIEEFVEGTLAWKVSHHGKIRDTMFRDVYSFIRDYNRDTGTRRQIDRSLCDRLTCAGATHSAEGELGERLATVQSQLAARLIGTVSHMVWAHGDYGYGNAIVDPGTGRLKGIIDWDQASEDLAGVDLVYFLLQKHRIETGGSLVSSFRQLGGVLVRNGLKALDPRLDYTEVFSISQRDLTVLLALAAIRIVFQEDRYAGLSGRPHPEFVEILKEASALLAENGDSRS